MKTNAANLESRFWRLPYECSLIHSPGETDTAFRWRARVEYLPATEWYMSSRLDGCGATRSRAISNALVLVRIRMKECGRQCCYDGGAGRCVLPLHHDGPHQAPEAKP